jgi:hypothetical protein
MEGCWLGSFVGILSCEEKEEAFGRGRGLGVMEEGRGSDTEVGEGRGIEGRVEDVERFGRRECGLRD